MPADPEPVTLLLQELGSGSEQAMNALMPIVYEQLRKQAAHCLSGERAGHTLPATALVHEAYLRLVQVEVSWQSRAHFYALAARLMRRILVDHARTKYRSKRGGRAEHIPIEHAVIVGAEPAESMLELDDALNRLAARDERKSRLVEMIFFGGLTLDEASAVLGTSLATAHRELKLAKAWLYVALADGDSVPPRP